MDRERMIKDEAEFRGYVVAKLESLDEFKESFKEHLSSEMDKLDTVNDRLKALENWKIKTTAMSSLIAAGFTFFVSRILK